MSKGVNKLLKNLEPEIDKKCMEIKEKKMLKHQQILYIILLILFITIPCFLIIFNINMTYFIISIIIIFLLITFVRLPNLLRTDVKGVDYE